MSEWRKLPPKTRVSQGVYCDRGELAFAKELERENVPQRGSTQWE